MGTLILFFIGLLLLILPLVPAFREWANPKDNEPLRVMQEYDNNVRHFAEGFRQYLAKNSALKLIENAAHSYKDTLDDGATYQVVGTEDGVSISAQEQQKKRLTHMIVSNHDLALPNDMLFEKEIYTGGNLKGGYNNFIRALLAEGDIHLEAGSKVLRWMHAGGAIHVSDNCELFGRVSSDDSITIGNDCRFERLHAGTIRFGKARARKATDPTGMPVIDELKNVLDHSGRRWLVDGNFTFKPRHRFNGDIVTRGECHIGDGAYIEGSIKSNEDMHVGAGVTVKGSLVSARNMLIGEECSLHGPVIAERTIIISRGTTIGTSSIPTTITAPEIFVDEEVLAHGTIWAHARGTVKPLQEAVRDQEQKTSINLSQPEIA